MFATIKQDPPVPIGYGETISAPHMHAEALRLLEGHIAPGASVLDVGSGELLNFWYAAWPVEMHSMHCKQEELHDTNCEAWSDIMYLVHTRS